MMHRDPSHSREKKRDAQTAFEELIARDPPPRRSRRVAAAEREKSQDDVGAAPRRKNEISVKKLGERDDERLASIARANPNASGTGTERVENSVSSRSLELCLPGSVRVCDLRDADTQTQTQTQTRSTQRNATQRTFETTAADELEFHEDARDAFAGAAFGDARAFVGGGAGLSPRTLKRNERAFVEALRGGEDGEENDCDGKKQSRGGEEPSSTEKSFGETPNETSDVAADPYLRLARLARGAAAAPPRLSSEKRESKTRHPPLPSITKPGERTDELPVEPNPPPPLSGVSVYLHFDVRGKRREIFAEKLPALGATMVDDAEKLPALFKDGKEKEKEKERKVAVAVTSDASFLATLSSRHPDLSRLVASARVVAACPEWAVECIKRGARVDPARFPPSAAAGPLRAPAKKPARGSSVAERRRAALEKTAESEARRGADAAARAARPAPGSSRDAVMAASVAADTAAASARTAIAAAAAAGGAPPSWVAIPDSESQERPYLGRVKARLACQKLSFHTSTSTALVGGGGETLAARANDEPDPDPDPPLFFSARRGALNARLIEPLLELADIYETVLGGVDKYKAKHHRTVAGALKELDFEVTDVSQLRSNPATGAPLTSAFGKEKSSVREKLGEILATGKLEKLEHLKRDCRVSALLELGKIWGVGPETARRLYQAGLRSVDSLRAAVANEEARGLTDRDGRLLTHAQRVGLKHYGEFDLKMPRAEAAAIGALVREAVDSVCGPGRCVVTLAGSYRRGKETCGDVDVLVAPSEAFAADASQFSEEEKERGLFYSSGGRRRQRGASANENENENEGSEGGSPGFSGADHGDVDPAMSVVARCASRERLPSPSRRYVDRLDDVLPAALALLRRRGLITDDLNSGDRRSYMGVCKLPPDVPLPGEDGDKRNDVSVPARLEARPDAENAKTPTAEVRVESPATEKDEGERNAPPDKSAGDSGRDVSVAPPPRRFRRVDIKVYSPEEYPFALLYFTGSGYFNRSMRWWADKKFHGLSLGDKGFRLESGAKESHFKHDPRFRGVTFATEKDVFDFLKLQYVEPEDRCV